MSFDTVSMYFRFIEPSSFEGVPTAMNVRSVCSIAVFMSVVALRLPFFRESFRMSSSPSSNMGDVPLLIRSIFFWSMSTHVT